MLYMFLFIEIYFPVVVFLLLEVNYRFFLNIKYLTEHVQWRAYIIIIRKFSLIRKISQCVFGREYEKFIQVYDCV